MKKSKVKTVWSLNESFEAHGKKFNKWGVLFENNDSGVFNTVDGYEPKFKMGEEADYSLTQDPKGGPAKIKYETPDFKPAMDGSNKRYDGRSKEDINAIVWQSCFSSVCSRFAGTSTENNKVLEFTDEAYHHCKALTEETKEPGQSSLPPEAPAFGPPPITIDDGDKLPF